MSDLRSILIFDTSIATKNLGDLIIVDAVQRELRSLFPKAQFLTAQTHDVVGKATYSLNRLAQLSFVAGTNLLSANMLKYRQWKLSFYDSLFLNNIVLMGVGWWQYQSRPNIYTKVLLKNVLCGTLKHSVRDGYTKQQFEAAGFKNVLNTGCPTMWGLTPEFCRQIPQGRGLSVVFTLTDYNKDRIRDKRLIDGLQDLYQSVYFWPQGAGDLDYLNELGKRGIHVLAPRLDSYDRLLAELVDLDYVGTRLHAGIRALQHGRRAVVIGVDNRAAEINRDTGLPVVGRRELESVFHLLEDGFKTEIVLNELEIAVWKAQFQSDQ